MPRRLALALLLLAPAAARTDATFTESDLYLRVDDQERTAVELAGELRGGDIRLQHASGSLEGEALGVPVDLRAEGGQVSGSFGDDPVALHLTESAGAFAYEGTVGDERLSGIVSPQLVSAAVGPCMAALGLLGRAYQGVLYCGKEGAHPMSLALPTSLSSSTGEQQVALVVSLMWAARQQTGP